MHYINKYHQDKYIKYKRITNYSIIKVQLILLFFLL